MNDLLKEEKLARARKRIASLKGFYWHLFVYIIMNLIFITIIGSSIMGSGGSFWNLGTFVIPFFWGIGLGLHALSVFGINFIFGKNWEARKIKELMDKDQDSFTSHIH
ncbi:2TM domain-containing protein [Ascidiimonas sp. W6]|uniref:2TM domain-containing protein n=1 Tax=Ascidiimonas meishanensis TaxID=3128903 RepID=UPI0030EB4E79